MIMVTMKQWNDLRDIANRLADAGADLIMEYENDIDPEHKLISIINEYNANYPQ